MFFLCGQTGRSDSVVLLPSDSESGSAPAVLPDTSTESENQPLAISNTLDLFESDEPLSSAEDPVLSDDEPEEEDFGGGFVQAFVFDDEAPTGTISSVSLGDPSLGQTYRDSVFNLTGVEDLISGIKELRYRIGLGAWTIAALPGGPTHALNIQLPEGWGDHDVEIEIEDFEGNVLLLERTVTVDFKAYITDVNLKYLADPYDATHGAFESTHSYPHEGYDQRLFTQPTHFGFAAQLLSNIIAKRIVIDYLSRDQAILILKDMITNLLNDQTNPAIGVMGLLPWMNFDAGAQEWRRDHDYGPGDTDTKNGRRFMLGDNSNMTVAFATALGALANAEDNLGGDVEVIKTKLETFLANQAPGYECLASATNNSTGSIRRGIIVASNAGSGFAVANCNEVFTGGAAVAFVNDQDTDEPNAGLPVAFETLYGTEFRAGILFAVLNYDLPDLVYKNLTVEIKSYVKQDSSTIYTVAPNNGSAFQMLWPAVTTPEGSADYPELLRMQKNFLDVALDFAAKNAHPAFLSASYVTGGNYLSNLGIVEIAQNSTGLIQTSTSLYTLGAALGIDSARMTPFIQEMLQRFPGLVTAHGLWEGVDMQNPAGAVIEQQVFSNVATFALGILATGGNDLLQYLSASQKTKLSTLWQPAGANFDVVADSGRAFSFALNGLGQVADIDTALTGRTGDTYRIVTSSLEAVGTAFKQGLTGDTTSVNTSGKRLIVRYHASTTAPGETTVGNLKIEFKDAGGLKIRQQVNEVILKNSGSTVNTFMIDFPAFMGTADINEIVFVLTGTGNSIDITFDDIDLIHLESVTPLEAAVDGGDGLDSARESLTRRQEYTLLSYSFFLIRARKTAETRIAFFENRLAALRNSNSEAARKLERELRRKLIAYKSILSDIQKLEARIEIEESTLDSNGSVSETLLDSMLAKIHEIDDFLNFQSDYPPTLFPSFPRIKEIERTNDRRRERDSIEKADPRIKTREPESPISSDQEQETDEQVMAQDEEQETKGHNEAEDQDVE